MRSGFQRAIRSVTLVFAVPGAALAGPPLSIDDPGILDPGKYEFILASSMEKRASGNAYFFPVIDVSYGISTNVQVAAVATRAINRPEEGSRKSDFGPGALGIKWRFLNQGDLQMSVAPYFESVLRNGAVDRGVVDDTEAWVLPVELQYQFADWRLNTEVRYAAARDTGDEWSYGIAGAVPLADRIEALVEFHGGADRTLDDKGLLYRLGLDLAVRDDLHVLVAAGSSFHEPGDDDLDFQAYLGLQWFP